MENAFAGYPWEQNAAQNGEIVLALGCDANGEVLNQDISAIPHFLVCGFSGAGKTSFIQSLLTQICQTQSPENVKLVIYDSKAIDYSVFNGIPHLLLPVITDERKVAGSVQWLYYEVQRRIKEFSAAQRILLDITARAIVRCQECLRFWMIFLRPI